MFNFTINDFAKRKLNHQKITMITAYDYLSAQLLENAGIDTILVGDSLGMVIQGKENTLSVDLNEILYHTKAVRKGAPNSFIIADMPWLSYHYDINTTIENAGRLISSGMANAVKLEINHLSTIKHIEALLAAQIPVITHIGMTPQSVNLFGGFKTQGKSEAEANHILEIAMQLEHSGSAAIVLECMPANLAMEITQKLTIPTIGIGAGPNCDGQVLVFHDLLGLTHNPPKFVKQYLNGRDLMISSINNFINEVKDNKFPIANVWEKL